MAAAVEVRNGYKFYGRSSNPKIVLNYLNMNVMRGSIYGLLGASGCGKTTLLSCIVGVRQLNSGDIRVLGLEPGLPGSGVPGPRIGYMPQEIALVEEMTVKETIYYFGRIYGLKDDRIRERYNLLKSLLELPPSKQFVSQCSGGQRRRISFACAMVHEPELLILDEPTVGLDPILREKIWDFLVETTRNSKMAVIITTHYIEEAKKANCIGLMRNGILLAEDSPQNIMNQFECDSLEESFLILSQRQGTSEEADKSLTYQTNYITSVDVIESSQIHDQNANIEEKPKPNPVHKLPKIQEQQTYSTTTDSDSSSSSSSSSTVNKCCFTSKTRMKALLTKNLIQLIRQPSGMLFMFLFPILQLSCFYLAIGKTPQNLRLGIVNDEINYEKCLNQSLITTSVISSNNNETCEFHKISCRYLHELPTEFAEKIYYNTADDAFKDAKLTDIIGYIHFPQNFSESMQILLEDGRFADEEVFENIQLVIRLDMSDQQISYYLERKLREAYQRFMEGLMSSCNIPIGLGRIPIHFEDPVYGSFDDEFQQYIAPGVVMTMVFFLATLMATAVFISERSDGVWDRTLVAGISTSEMLMAHMCSQSVIMILQSLEVIFYIAFVFETKNQGDGSTLILLLILNGFCGMLFGLLISIYCESHTMSNFVATGAFYPMIILCGLLWPIEGMPKLLQNIVLVFPFTVPVISARNILEKGWSLANFQVYNGFLVIIGWIIIFFAFCVIGLRRKA